MKNAMLEILEKNAFGVCSWLGEKMNIKTQHIRMSFIYLSFITFGSPLFIYLVMAFVLRHKDYFYFKKRKTIWEL